jgi:hypothetical protein
MTAGYTASWRNPRILVLLFLVFLSGAIAGALTMRFRLHQRVLQRSSFAASSPAYKEAGKEISLERFKRELDLTPEQAREFESVLDDFVMYHHTLQSQMDDVRSSGKERIRHLLTDRQREKFDRMMSELQTRQVK